MGKDVRRSCDEEAQLGGLEPVWFSQRKGSGGVLYTKKVMGGSREDRWFIYRVLVRTGKTTETDHDMMSTSGAKKKKKKKKKKGYWPNCLGKKGNWTMMTVSSSSRGRRKMNRRNGTFPEEKAPNNHCPW